MKYAYIFVSLFLHTLVGHSIQANNEPMAVTKIVGADKEVTLMYQIVEGAVNLFYEPTDVIQYKIKDQEGFVAVNTVEVDIYYIGIGKEVEQINPGNYKRFIRKYLPNASELYQRLGKRGFRFENIPSMILYYNKSVVGKSQPLTKSDLAKLRIL